MLVSRLATVAAWAPLARTALTITLASVVVGGCAHNPAANRTRGQSIDVTPGLAAEDLETQSLFRVRYQGAAGSGSLRLVLKLESADRYLIETKDRFGRGLWRIEADSSARVLVDDRRRVFCETEGGIRIPEMGMESLPLSQLPAILLGRLPGDLKPTGGAGEYQDLEGRFWTARATGSELSSWTLLEGDEPWVWWSRQASGDGVLSHRTGSQLRWRLVAIEPMSLEIPRLVLTEEYVRIACENWPGVAGKGAVGH